MAKKYKSLIIKILISGALFYFLITRIDMEMVISNFSNINLIYTPIIVLFLILNYVLGAFRWKALLIFEGTEDITVGYLSILYFVGSFFNNFMPTSIGGDVYKFYKLGRKIGSVAHGFSSTFMERFTGVVMLFLITLISFPLVLSDVVEIPILTEYGLNNRGFAILASFLSLGLFIFGMFIGIKVLGIISSRFTKLQKLYESIMSYKGNTNVIITALVTSIFVQLLSIFTQYFIFKSMGVDLPPLYALTVFPVIALISFLPISLNGIGVQDALYVNLFSIVGVPAAVSLSASLLYHLFRLGVSLIGGALYALGKDS